MADLPSIAAQAFTRRQQRARDAIRRRTMTVEQADRHLAPWLAIALLCGADLPETAEAVAFGTDPANCLIGKPPSERTVRLSLADDLCPRAEWEPVLRTAFLNALARDPKGEATTGLTALVVALSVPLDVAIPEPIKEAA